jgi:hypothetical protein
MTHACCLACRLRLTPAAAAYAGACPECGGSLDRSLTAQQLVGFQLVADDVLPEGRPIAVAVAIPIPGWETRP